MKAAIAILISACCVMAVAACGDSGSKGASAASNPQLKLSECMRAHGVPNFPDPTQGSGGEGLSVSQEVGSDTTTVGGIPFSGPVFEAAITTCKFFGGGSAPPAVSESQKLQMFRFAECLRAHGVPNYPDPVFPAGGGIERPSVPGLNLNSPSFQRAAKLCNRP
jgi:hypothetical protein